MEIWNHETGFHKGFCVRSTTWKDKQTIWTSPTSLLYGYASFQGQTNGLNFCSTVSHRFNLRKTRKSETVMGRNLIPFETVKSSHFPTLRFHSNGRLSDFLPSCLPLLSVYKYWQNPADLVSLNPSSFVLHSFAWFFLFPFFIFCNYLCHAVVWMIVMQKFWLLGLLICALTFGSILTEALLPLSCCGVDDSFDCCGF